MPKPSGPSAAEHSPVSASGRRATTASKSASGRSSLTGKHPSLPKGLGTAAVRVVVKRLPQSKLSTLGRESARSVAATRIQAAARGMLVRRRLPVSGYLQMRATRFPYRWRRRFVSLELSTATLVWSRQPGRRPLGTVVVRGCARSAHATHCLVLRCASAGGANGRGGGGELQLRLRAASAASAEEWARALARAAATVAMAAARGNDGGGTGADADADAAAAPFVPSAVVPRLEEVGLAIRLVGRKPAGFALGKGQLHLHVRGAQFWKALEGVVPAAAPRVARHAAAAAADTRLPARGRLRRGDRGGRRDAPAAQGRQAKGQIDRQAAREAARQPRRPAAHARAGLPGGARRVRRQGRAAHARDDAGEAARRRESGPRPDWERRRRRLRRRRWCWCWRRWCCCCWRQRTGGDDALAAHGVWHGRVAGHDSPSVACAVSTAWPEARHVIARRRWRQAANCGRPRPAWVSREREGELCILSLSLYLSVSHSVAGGGVSSSVAGGSASHLRVVLCKLCQTRPNAGALGVCPGLHGADRALAVARGSAAYVCVVWRSSDGCDRGPPRNPRASRPAAARATIDLGHAAGEGSACG